jgi:hypothetical protein
MRKKKENTCKSSSMGISFLQISIGKGQSYNLNKIECRMKEEKSQASKEV